MKTARCSVASLRARAGAAERRLRALWSVPEQDSDLWECGVIVSEDRDGAADVTAALMQHSRANCQQEAEAIGLALVLLPGGTLEVTRSGLPMLKLQLGRTEEAVVRGMLAGEKVADTAREIGRHKQTLYMYRDRFARKVRAWSVISCSRCGRLGAYRTSHPSGAFICNRSCCADWNQPSQPTQAVGATQ